jgi:hypothetical protein
VVGPSVGDLQVRVRPPRVLTRKLLVRETVRRENALVYLDKFPGTEHRREDGEQRRRPPRQWLCTESLISLTDQILRKLHALRQLW